MVKKITTPLGKLTRQVENLAPWHVKMSSWHVFGTFARGHVGT